MTTNEKVESTIRKIEWFVSNRSLANYALTELAEAKKYLLEVQETLAVILPQVNDLMEGRAKLIYPRSNSESESHHAPTEQGGEK